MKNPRISIIQCVSTSLEMLKFSTDSLIKNSGYDNFDYIIVTWLASDQVKKQIKIYQEMYDFVHMIDYPTNDNIGYVPNLRGMMNLGFDKGFKLNDYCCLVNTDQYFGKDWLKNLVKYVTPNLIVNSVQITPIEGPPYITANLNITEYDKFNLDKFNEMYQNIYKDNIEMEEERGGWFACNTMPYIFHKKYWKLCGPWELTLDKNFKENCAKKGYCDSPDSRFFERCHEAGAKECMVWSSICYHHEAVERRGKRPKGAEYMINEDGVNGKT